MRHVIALLVKIMEWGVNKLQDKSLVEMTNQRTLLLRGNGRCPEADLARPAELICGSQVFLVGRAATSGMCRP